MSNIIFTIAHTEGARISLNVTTVIASAVHTRSPVTITCTARFAGTTGSDATLDISWSKDGKQLQNSSELTITSSNTTAVSYHSNMTIHVLKISDSGSYACRVQLSQPGETPSPLSDVSTIHLAVKGISLLEQLVHYYCVHSKHVVDC